jgi:Rod binding domain-containing protein
MVAALAAMGVSAAANVLNGVVDTINSTLGATQSSGTQSATSTSGKARKTADDFEKMFLEHSLGEVTKDSGEDGPLGDNGTGGSVYKSMLVKEYAGEIVKTGGVGIADQIYRQMLQMQESARVGG